jgi:hypothetical protein
LGAVVQWIQQGSSPTLTTKWFGQNVFGGVFALARFAGDVGTDHGRFICEKIESDCAT